MRTTPTADGVIEALARELREEGSLLSAHVRSSVEASPALGELVASGRRAAAEPTAFATIVESIREGYLLHYGRPRLIDPPDPDVALLAGDYLYAKGLQRLAALGDPEAVAELSDLISLSAQLHADRSGEGVDPAAAALWLASVVAVATGPSTEHDRAKAELRAAGTVEGLYAVARARAASAELDQQFARASDAVGFPSPHLG